MSAEQSAHAPRYCAACYPQKIKGHHVRWILEFFTAPLWQRAPRRLKKTRALSFYLPVWLNALHAATWFLGVARIAVFKRSINRADFNNRALAVFDAAEARGLQPEAMYIGKRGTNQMRVRLPGSSRVPYYFAVPLTGICSDIDDKGTLMGFLHRYGFPVPEGKIFWRKKSGCSYGMQRGFPLVVKPVRGSRSAHATYPITNQEELARAIRIAQAYEPRYFIQRYIPGDLYRFTVVHGTHVFAARRRPPHVVGNGTATVRALIEAKNSDPRRAAAGVANATLHAIPLDGVTVDFLARTGRSLDDVPASGERVMLGPKISIGSGGDLEEVTPHIHPDTRVLFQNIGKKLDVDIVGFDVMCTDATVSWKQQTFAIIEGNALPFLDFHEYPGAGEPQPVAGLLWDGIIERLGLARRSHS